MTELVKKYVLGPNNVFIPVSVLGIIFVFFTGSMFAVAKNVWDLSKSVTEFQASIDKRFDCVDRRMEAMDNRFNYIMGSFKQHAVNEWGRTNMEKWAYLLEKSNRNMNLSVPDPSLAKIGGQQSE